MLKFIKSLPKRSKKIFQNGRKLCEFRRSWYSGVNRTIWLLCRWDNEIAGWSILHSDPIKGRQTNGGYSVTSRWPPAGLTVFNVKLRNNPQDLADYDKEIQQLITNKFVDKADMEYDGYHAYLPHQPVYRKDKATTKIRPVFDGAVKTKFGPSLKEVLETGPNLNSDILSATMRFRMNRCAWIADIEKAFLNIALQPEDSEAITFLWPEEPSKWVPL